jgi:hypothetical protein
MNRYFRENDQLDLHFTIFILSLRSAAVSTILCNVEPELTAWASDRNRLGTTAGPSLAKVTLISQEQFEIRADRLYALPRK